ncbi:MAG: hypothetical protein M0R03_15705 [Novosphingobium sp.]|nr:hypothetical protein [Novosphingobium sp.]
MKRKFLSLAACLLIAAPGIAQAAEPPCLAPAEFTSLAGYALPSLISGTTARCGASLGPSAFLSRSGKDLATRYAQGKTANWPGAKAAFLKLSASTNKDANQIIGTLPDATLQQMLDAVMEGMAGQQIPVEKCGTIDNVVRLLSPLPPANTAELIALAVGLGAKSGPGKNGKAKVGSFTLCPA